MTEPTLQFAENAFEKLYLEYGIFLRAVAMRRYRVPPDDAEAIVQDAFVVYLQRHTTIREVKPWLLAVVRNISRNYWRDRRREAVLDGAAGAEELDGWDEECGIAACAAGEAPDESEQWALRITVGTIVARLGEKCRETIQRYYWREESKETIAASLSTSPDYVRQLLVSCRRRLRALLDETGKGGV